MDVPALDADVNTITLRGPQEKLGQALTQVCVCVCVFTVCLPTLSFPSSLPLSVMDDKMSPLTSNSLLFLSSAVDTTPSFARIFPVIVNNQTRECADM